MTFDPRLTLLRDGVAEADLEGVLPADRFLATRALRTIVAAAAVRAAPDPRAEQLNQLLYGEDFQVLETSGEFVLGKASRDGYVGWVEAAALAAETAIPTHWVSALRTYVFEDASIKAPARGPLSLNALVTIVEETQTLVRDQRMGWLARRHLSAIGTALADPVAVALSHLGAPYLWGGRESVGLDCSGLVQQALLACGVGCARDTDQQQSLGVDAPPDELARGDLVFWTGHVAMMIDAARIVHANAFHMAVAVEALAGARARIAAGGAGQPIAYRRLSLGRKSAPRRRRP